jgi:hypothetical protein
LGSCSSTPGAATFGCRRYCCEIRNIFRLHPTILRIGYARFHSRNALISGELPFQKLPAIALTTDPSNRVSLKDLSIEMAVTRREFRAMLSVSQDVLESQVNATGTYAVTAPLSSLRPDFSRK